jgi:hypothetical protein
MVAVRAASLASAAVRKRAFLAQALNRVRIRV